MPIHINCPDCNKSYKVDEKHEGKKIRCKDCSATIEIYSDSISPDDSDDYEERSERRRSRRFYSDEDSYYSSSAPKSGVSSVLGVLSIILGAIGLVIAFMPCIGFIGLPAAGLGLILGIIGFFLPDAAKTSGRNLSIIGGSLSIVAFIVVGAMMLLMNRAANEVTKKIDEQAAKMHEEQQARIKEHQDKFKEQAEKRHAEHNAEFKEQTERMRARHGAAVLSGSLRTYMFHHNSEPPKSIDDLLPHVPFKDPKRLIDPWGNRYQIGETVGPDGKKDYYIFTIHPTTKEEIRSDK